MKFILILFLVIGLNANPISKDCTYKGKKIFGKVKIVEWGQNFQVKTFTWGADIHVKVTNGVQRNCGEWQFVEWGEDFSIKIVDYGQDFSIQYVTYSPGLK